MMEQAKFKLFANKKNRKKQDELLTLEFHNSKSRFKQIINQKNSILSGLIH